MKEPGFGDRVAAEIAPHLPPGFTVEAVKWHGDDCVRVWLGTIHLGAVNGTWDHVVDGVQALVDRELSRRFRIPRKETAPG
ncbi:MAG: hypothetical protein U0237_12120 [Thermoleophilia bacterium]